MYPPNYFHFIDCFSIKKKKAQRHILFEEQSLKESDYYKSFKDPSDFEIPLNPNTEYQILL